MKSLGMEIETKYIRLQGFHKSWDVSVNANNTFH
jgi:hypothetical protein